MSKRGRIKSHPSAIGILASLSPQTNIGVSVATRVPNVALMPSMVLWKSSAVSVDLKRSCFPYSTRAASVDVGILPAAGWGSVFCCWDIVVLLGNLKKFLARPKRNWHINHERASFGRTSDSTSSTLNATCHHVHNSNNLLYQDVEVVVVHLIAYRTLS